MVAIQGQWGWGDITGRRGDRGVGVGVIGITADWVLPSISLCKTLLSHFSIKKMIGLKMKRSATCAMEKELSRSKMLPAKFVALMENHCSAYVAKM